MRYFEDSATYLFFHGQRRAKLSNGSMWKATIHVRARHNCSAAEHAPKKKAIVYLANTVWINRCSDSTQEHIMNNATSDAVTIRRAVWPITNTQNFFLQSMGASLISFTAPALPRPFREFIVAKDAGVRRYQPRGTTFLPKTITSIHWRKAKFAGNR